MRMHGGCKLATVQSSQVHRLQLHLYPSITTPAAAAVLLRIMDPPPSLKYTRFYNKAQVPRSAPLIVRTPAANMVHLGRLFSPDTSCIFYNFKDKPVQRMLDFDFVCGAFVCCRVQDDQGGRLMGWANTTCCVRSCRSLHTVSGSHCDARCACWVVLPCCTWGVRCGLSSGRFWCRCVWF